APYLCDEAHAIRKEIRIEADGTRAAAGDRSLDAIDREVVLMMGEEEDCVARHGQSCLAGEISGESVAQRSSLPPPMPSSLSDGYFMVCAPSSPSDGNLRVASLPRSIPALTPAFTLIWPSRKRAKNGSIFLSLMGSIPFDKG